MVCVCARVCECVCAYVCVCGVHMYPIRYLRRGDVETTEVFAAGLVRHIHRLASVSGCESYSWTKRRAKLARISDSDTSAAQAPNYAVAICDSARETLLLLFTLNCGPMRMGLLASGDACCRKALCSTFTGGEGAEKRE
jgi:hypothetical protein